MTVRNPYLHAARSLASNGLDILIGALGNSIKEHAGLPIRPSTARSQLSSRFVVTEAAEATGAAMQWSDDGTLALLTIPHAGRHWRVLTRDHLRIVELLAPTGLRFAPGEMPGELVDNLLTRAVLFGGYVLSPDEGQRALHCRATLPADALNPAVLSIAIEALVAEVAELYDRLRL